MKTKFALVRRAILTMVGTTTMCLGVAVEKISAVPENVIREKLYPVPVFTIVDEQGAPLVASGKDGGKIAGAFISQQDANNFLTSLQGKNPDLASRVRVIPLSLHQVYELNERSSEASEPDYAYVPNEEAVNYAKSILGTQYQGGVPLFLAKGGEGNHYLTIERDGQQVVPFFFEKQQLENMVAKLKTERPDLANNFNIEVIPLEALIYTLQTNESPMLSNIVLVPSTESLQFISEHSREERAAQSNQNSGGLTPEQQQKLEEVWRRMDERNRAMMGAGKRTNEVMGVQQFLLPF